MNCNQRRTSFRSLSTLGKRRELRTEIVEIPTKVTASRSHGWNHKPSRSPPTKGGPVDTELPRGSPGPDQSRSRVRHGTHPCTARTTARSTDRASLASFTMRQYPRIVCINCIASGEWLPEAEERTSSRGSYGTFQDRAW